MVVFCRILEATSEIRGSSADGAQPLKLFCGERGALFVGDNRGACSEIFGCSDEGPLPTPVAFFSGKRFEALWIFGCSDEGSLPSTIAFFGGKRVAVIGRCELSLGRSASHAALSAFWDEVRKFDLCLAIPRN